MSNAEIKQIPKLEEYKEKGVDGSGTPTIGVLEHKVTLSSL